MVDLSAARALILARLGHAGRWWEGEAAARQDEGARRAQIAQ
jgi:hypothetical protein